MIRILLVEDNEFNRDALSRHLIRKGFDVVVAASGEEGLRLGRTAGADLVLMDLGMPDIDGWECARRLRAHPDTRRLPVIALTAHATPDDRQRALDAGCDDFDTKPVDLSRLLAKIDQLIGKRA